MGFLYEPGPLEFLDPSRFPDDVHVDGEMETLVTPSAATLIAAEGYTAVRVSEIAGAGVPDIDGETSRVLRPAYDELGYQLATLHELDPSPTARAFADAVGETDGVRADLPSEDSHWEPPLVPGEGAVEPIDTSGPAPPPEI